MGFYIAGTLSWILIAPQSACFRRRAVWGLGWLPVWGLLGNYIRIPQLTGTLYFCVYICLLGVLSSHQSSKPRRYHSYYGLLSYIYNILYEICWGPHPLHRADHTVAGEKNLEKEPCHSESPLRTHSCFQGDAHCCTWPPHTSLFMYHSTMSSMELQHVSLIFDFHQPGHQKSKVLKGSLDCLLYILAEPFLCPSQPNPRLKGFQMATETPMGSWAKWFLCLCRTARAKEVILSPHAAHLCMYFLLHWYPDVLSCAKNQ